MREVATLCLRFCHQILDSQSVAARANGQSDFSLYIIMMDNDVFALYFLLCNMNVIVLAVLVAIAKAGVENSEA